MKRLILFLSILILSLIFIGCGGDPIPKPKGMLRLDYPTPNYKDVTSQLPFKFEMNSLAKYRINTKRFQGDSIFGLDIEYPKLKGTIYLTYKKVTKNNLISFLRDAQNITQTHAVKADEIVEQPFINKDKNVFGMFYEVGGNAASQSQFYVTDSTNHFLNGSLYFYATPNYDSILPAADYLKNDIRKIMESLEWTR